MGYVVRNSVGDYSIFFTVAMPDSNYVALGSIGHTLTSHTNDGMSFAAYIYAPTYLRGHIGHANGYYDLNQISVLIH